MAMVEFRFQNLQNQNHIPKEQRSSLYLRGPKLTSIVETIGLVDYTKKN